MISKAVEMIAHDLVVAYPTDTFYALGAAPTKEALDLLDTIKGDRQGPYSLAHCDTSEIRDRYLLSDQVDDILDVFLPGPMTLI